MTNSRRLCICGQPAAPWSPDCLDCLMQARERRRVRSFVPTFGDQIKRLSGETGICPACQKRGCMRCAKEKNSGR